VVPAGFKNGVRIACKAGGYTLCIDGCKHYRSIAGYLELPYLTPYGPMPQRYVFGLFIERATDEDKANTALKYGLLELLEAEVHKAFKTWV
jgi:hypothetical protein